MRLQVLWGKKKRKKIEKKKEERRVGDNKSLYTGLGYRYIRKGLK